MTTTPLRAERTRAALVLSLLLTILTSAPLFAADVFDARC